MDAEPVVYIPEPGAAPLPAHQLDLFAPAPDEPAPPIALYLNAGVPTDAA
jgi:hypothetical protein